MTTNYENNFLEAIQLVAKNAIENAQWNQTVKAIIVKAVDLAIGKYLVKYQDSSFYAYSPNINLEYQKGAYVYLLIPNNDMEQDKIILGAVNRESIMRVKTTKNLDKYEIMGTNCIHDDNIYSICSYKENDLKILYDRNDISAQILNVNIDDLEEYVKNNSLLVCTVDMKTNLPSEQRIRGNYGIVYELTYEDGEGSLYTKQYVIDINQITGTPYNFADYTTQTRIFDIQDINFKYLNRIYIFQEDFPHIEEGREDDIFFKNISLYGANPLNEEDMNGYYMLLDSSQGTYFKDAEIGAKKAITAIIKESGQVINLDLQHFDFYWFRENASVTPDSLTYNYYGGNGWECMNPYTEPSETTRIYSPLENIYEVEQSNMNSQKEKYKCVAVKDNIMLIKTLTFVNYDAPYEISIVSDMGYIFFDGIGNPTLTCLVNGVEQTDSDYTYKWSTIDINNNTIEREETTDLNTEYNNAVTQLNNIELALESEVVFPNAVNETKTALQNLIKRYDTIERIENQHFYKININTILNQMIFNCSVFYRNSFIGNSFITLYNKVDDDAKYTLSILNGEKIYSYDEYGISPSFEGRENPLKIIPLELDFINDKGDRIDNSIVENYTINWDYPEDIITRIEDLDHPATFKYNIVDEFDINRTEAKISATLNFRGKVYQASTNIKLIQQGDAGSDRSGYSIRIVPNSETQNEIPACNNGVLNFSPLQAGKWFKVQIWKRGNKIYEGTTSGATSEGPIATVEWDNLHNEYGELYNADGAGTGGYFRGEESFFIYDKTLNTFGFNPIGRSYTTENAKSWGDIVRCKVNYNGKTYTTCLPIISTQTGVGYRIKLDTSSGYQNVRYDKSGRNPLYREKPFKIIVEKMINGYWEDISNATQAEKLIYTWNITGGIFQPTGAQTGVWNEKILLEKENNDLLNEKNIITTLEYFGDCVNPGILVNIKKYSTNTNIGSIYIPIYFYINNDTISANIDNWNGNSVEIDKNGKYILSPQIGAGKKENDNSFSGMIMGSAKEDSYREVNGSMARTCIEKNGLLGYDHGQQSLFLDAESGGGLFGKDDNGQFIIDPNQQKSYLYSRNYWKEYDNKGFPRSYEEFNENGAGMLIDLDTPEIKFGNGNFYIDEEGNMILQDLITQEGKLTQIHFEGVRSTTNIFANTFADFVERETECEYYLLGYDIPYYSHTTWTPKQNVIVLNYYIPKNFTLSKAKLILRHHCFTIDTYQYISSTHNNRHCYVRDSQIIHVNKWATATGIVMNSDVVVGEITPQNSSVIKNLPSFTDNITSGFRSTDEVRNIDITSELLASDNFTTEGKHDLVWWVDYAGSSSNNVNGDVETAMQHCGLVKMDLVLYGYLK